MKNIFFGTVAFLCSVELSHSVSEFDVDDAVGFERLFSLSVLPAYLNDNYESSDSETEGLQEGSLYREEHFECDDNDDLEAPTTPIMNGSPDDVYSSPEI